MESRPLRNVVGADTGGPHGRRKDEPGHGPEDYDKFIDLVQRMLVYDPRHRIRPEEALAHRFFLRKEESELVICFTHLLLAVFSSRSFPTFQNGLVDFNVLLITQALRHFLTVVSRARLTLGVQCYLLLLLLLLYF